MVDRKEGGMNIDDFDGKVVSVEFEVGANENRQYHITVKPTSITVGGKTGMLHEWIPLSPSSTEEAIAKGSVMDGYLRQVEICVPEAKKAQTVTKALQILVGKNFHFTKMELGRAYGGNPARQYSVPVKAL